MKPSELKKDDRASVRINSKVKDEIKRRGLSVQKLLDQAIDKLIKFKILNK